MRPEIGRTARPGGSLGTPAQRSVLLHTAQSVHRAWYQWHRAQGQRSTEQVPGGGDDEASDTAVD